MWEAQSCNKSLPSSALPEVKSVKACPQCGQEIQDEAIKCRYCRSWLVPPPAGLHGVPSQIVIRQNTTSGMAIASLVMGLLWMYWIGSILAICLGYAARREIRNNAGRIEGQGMATAGIVLGWIGIGMLALMIVVFLYLRKTDTSRPGVRETRSTAAIVERRRTAQEYFACA
jgi:predicted RNA-binding Zn-ribbon protein involved in translation (DUF1610 family)